MVDDLIRLYDKDAKPKTIKSNSNKTSTTVLNGSNSENWMFSKNAYSPRFYGSVENGLNSLIGEYSQNNNINNGAVNIMVGNDDKIFYKYSKEPSTDFIKNMFKIGITNRFTKQIDGTIPGKNLIDPRNDDSSYFKIQKTDVITKDGVTFTLNSDNSITVNTVAGGATETTSIRVYGHSGLSEFKFLLTGCPEGGSQSSYKILDGTNFVTDTGSGTTSNKYVTGATIWIQIAKGMKIEGLIFKPQLYNLTDIFGRDKEPKTVSDFYLKYYCNFAWIKPEIFADKTQNKYGIVPEVPNAVASATTFDGWLYIKFFNEALEMAGHKSDDEVSLKRLLGPSDAGGFDIKFSFYSYEPKIFYTQMFQNEAYVNPDNYDSVTGWEDGFVLKRMVGDNNICKRFTKAGFEEAIKKYSETADYKIAYMLDEFGGLYLFCPKESNGGSYKWITAKNENGDVYDSIDKFTRILAGNNITVEYKTVTLKDEWGGLGLGILSEISSPLVKRELNGEYEFSFTYPVTGRHFNELKPRAIVVTKPSANENPQGFRIYKTTKPINGQITVNCQHISYDQSGIFAIPFATPVSESGSSLYSSDDMISSLIGAASKISPDSEFAKTGRITVEGGKVLVNQQFYSDDPKSLRSLIGADDGSILSILGGDVVFDNFKTTFYPKGYGNKTGFSIRYGKNMTEYSEEEDESGAYSRVYPFWKPKNSTSTSSSNLDNYKINPAYAAGSNISGSSNTDSVLSSPGKTFTTNVDLSQYAGQDTPFKSYLIDFMKNGGHLDTNTILESPDKTERYIYNGKGVLIDPNESTQETAETTDETNYLDLDGYSRFAGTKATIEGEEYVSLFADGRIIVADQENIDNPYFKTMTLDLSDAFENKGLLTYDSIDNFPKPSEITKTQAKCIFADSSKSRKYLYDPFKDSGTKDKDGHIIYGAYIDYSGTPDKNALYLEAYWYIVENDIAKPKVTFTLSYVELYRNKDASALSVLEQVNLGDTIKIKMNLYNTDVDVKCTGMSYNPISKRVESITVGTPKKDLASTISEQTEKISKTPDKKTVSTLVDSTIAPALQVTTSLITGNTGGFAMLYNSRTGKTSTTPKATTAWATMNEDGKSGIPFRTYDEMYNFITNLEGGISDDILFKYAPGVKKEDGTYDYTNAPVYDFTWSSRLLRARIFDISIDNSDVENDSARLIFKSILFNVPLWYNNSEYESGKENTEAKWFSFSTSILKPCGKSQNDMVKTRITIGLEPYFIDSKFHGYCFTAKFIADGKEYSGRSIILDSEDISGSRSISIKFDRAKNYYFVKVDNTNHKLDDIGVVWSSGFEKYNQDISAPDEFLIMNTNDINTATQVWRWNKSGLMFSKSEKPGDAYFGFNSETPLAMDMTGKIIANEIYADKLQINDVTVDNGLYLRGKYAEKVFSSENGFTVINPNSSSAYIKYTFQDGEIKPLPTETNNVLYYTEDFHNTDETSNDPLSGVLITETEKHALLPVTYNALLSKNTVSTPTEHYVAVSNKGELVFKLYNVKNESDISVFFSTKKITLKYPVENRTSFYADPGIDTVFSGKTYATVVSGAHRETNISVKCGIYSADSTEHGGLVVEKAKKIIDGKNYTELSIWYRAVPGETTVTKPGTINDKYNWADSLGGTIPIYYSIKNDKKRHFTEIAVPPNVTGGIENNVPTGIDYKGSVIIPYAVDELQEGDFAVSTVSGKEANDAGISFLQKSPEAKIYTYNPNKNITNPIMYIDGVINPYSEKTSLGRVEINSLGVYAEQRFENGCFKIVDTKTLVAHDGIETHGDVNFKQYDGEVPHGIYGVNEIDFYEPNSSGYIPTNITAKTVGTNDAFMSKIDLTRGCKYLKDSAGNLYISEFRDSEGGLIKFPFINGMKDSTTDTLHTPSGGAYCVGFSEYDFTSGGTSVRLPCLVIYWYLNGRWRPKYRFRLSDIAGYDNSGNLTGWVPNTTK